MASLMPSYRIILADSRYMIIVNPREDDYDTIRDVFVLNPSPEQEATIDRYQDHRYMLNDGGPPYTTLLMEFIMDDRGSVVAARFIGGEQTEPDALPGDESAMVVANFIAEYQDLQRSNALAKDVKISEYSFKSKEEENGEEVCVICQEEYEDDEMIGRLECRHEFHVKCIKKWLIHKNMCPLCRATF